MEPGDRASSDSDQTIEATEDSSDSHDVQTFLDTPGAIEGAHGTLGEATRPGRDQSIAPVPDRPVDPDADSIEEEVVEHQTISMGSRLARLRPVIFIICIFALGVNHLRCSPQAILTRGLPEARAVHQNTAYLDVYDGDLSRVFEEFLRHEMTVSLYYAPWDAKSLKSLKILDELAKGISDVRFIAISCWQNPSCTKYYEFKFYPSASVYVRGLGSIQYPMGSISKEYLATFIYNIINPISVISEASQWSQMRAKHFAVVTAPMEHFQFAYTLALEALRRDPQQRVGFAILRDSRLAPAIRLHLSNETLEYTEEANPTVGAVAKWIYSKATEPYTVLGNPGFKSARFRQAINGTRAFAVIKSPPSTRLNVQLHLMSAALFGCQDSPSNHTRDMLISLIMRLQAESSACKKNSSPIECVSNGNHCLKLMASVSYRKHWAGHITQYCRESEQELLKRSERQKFCLTQWALPEKEAFTTDFQLYGLACGREDRFRIIVLDAALFESMYPAEAPVVIFDTVEEVKYLLPEDQFSARGIEIFLRKFLTKSNEILKRSTSLVRTDLFHSKAEDFVPPNRTPGSAIHDTVVLFYTNWCGFCKSFTAAYFRVANFFGTAPISFRRVDAEGSRFEDIKYAPDSYPQVVFFPRNSSDSFRYRGPWKAQGLTRFIFEHCNEDVLQSF
ncbi:thioredoxin domain-containing protein 11-like [Galendromus occidentalis]|uniref:Thioredoxin domain-containing protein 11-like n=1 Tax=Galendromus occidentalis TaxID=34638 RepID=A0AAJ7L575_9ACAR|nr:thioredoxin domain-containing protein 11-like [Galendromus occidentalis]